MPQYSLNSLMVFAAVVKAKSFSRAAEALCMTQPGVSAHIAQLEAQTGFALIRRDRGRCELTREGRFAYRYAEKIEKLAHELEDGLKVHRGDTAPSLSLGTPINYAKVIMPYILEDFQKKHPGTRIKLDTGPSAGLEKTLLLGQNDIIIVANEHVSRKIQSFPFVREELMLITSKDHPLARKETVSLSDTRPYPFIIREEGSATRRVVLEAFSRAGIVPSVLIEANSMEFIKAWVSRGKGVSILISRAINAEEDPSLRSIPLADPLFLEVAVLYLKAKKHNPSIQRFILYLRELLLTPDSAPFVFEVKKREEFDRKSSAQDPAASGLSRRAVRGNEATLGDRRRS